MDDIKFPIADHTLSVYQCVFLGDSNSDLGIGKYSQVQLQSFAEDADRGVSTVTDTFKIKNFAGDFSGDISVDSEDLQPFALAWRKQDLSKEIGPASGEPPRSIPDPDGIIDFEDLIVLVQQWNCSFAWGSRSKLTVERDFQTHGN